ncbi:hypothetical protein EJ04DRAFT_605347 [Polyplosphaeria fusca]|uniref:DUF8021 domain-containing protein n=1 Tax=Polyplosphaeria fusca TaxID=682080 RepID=A0A9P4V2R8_9PLEO|nr:hypothetical protein EJ04DRAFT_605347 [Polyplosphaeria fusca]
MAILYFTSWLLFSTLAIATPFSKRACDKTVLIAAADAYLSSQASGSLSSLSSSLSGNYTYMENNKVMSARNGVLGKALKIDHRRTIYDVVQCATYTEYISTSDPANPYVNGVQMRHAADGKVSSVDVIASTTNSWLFNATSTLLHVQQESWTPLPVVSRSSREVVQAAGDAYLDMWSNATAHLTIPWGTPCARLEGGQYTGKGKPDDSCQPGIPTNHSQKGNTNRRYVFDEEMGSVSIFCLWQHMMNAADSHEFRLEGGKLRYVHTMTECGGKRCSL